MKPNKIAREQIFQIITNQIRDNNPPETKLTMERLKALGYSDLDAKKLIGQCIAVETYQILKFKRPFDEARYIASLKKLPEEPFDD